MQSAQSPVQNAAAPDYAVLRWLVGATFVVILNETIMINAIPRLMVDFDVNASAAQWLSTAFMLTMAVVIPITGWFLQRVTTRFAFGLAMGLFCAGTLLAAAGPDVPGAAGRADRPGRRYGGHDAPADDHPDGRRTRERPRPCHGQRQLAISVAPALGPAVSGVILHSFPGAGSSSSCCRSRPPSACRVCVA